MSPWRHFLLPYSEKALKSRAFGQNEKAGNFYQNYLPFVAEMERFACIRFSLAGDGKSDKSIDQFLNWSMNMPPACSDMIRISPYFMKNTSPTLRQGMCFHGGDGEIRTLEELLTLTRFPIVRARPTTRHLHVFAQENPINLSACLL